MAMTLGDSSNIWMTSKALCGTAIAKATGEDLGNNCEANAAVQWFFFVAPDLGRKSLKWCRGAGEEGG